MTVTRDQLRNWVKRDKWLKPHAKQLSPEEQANADIWAASWIKACKSPQRNARVERVSLEEARAILEARRPKTEGEKALFRAREAWSRVQIEYLWPKRRRRREKPRSRLRRYS
jgi:hypothetical protein